MDYSEFEAKLKARIMEGVPPIKERFGDDARNPSYGVSCTKTAPSLSKPTYLIVVRDVVKIGVSYSLPRRIKTIKTSLAHPIDAVYVDTGFHLPEKFLHEKFKHHRLEGEWFILADEIKEYIDDCLQGGILRKLPQKGQTGI